MNAPAAAPPPARLAASSADEDEAGCACANAAAAAKAAANCAHRSSSGACNVPVVGGAEPGKPGCTRNGFTEQLKLLGKNLRSRSNVESGEVASRTGKVDLFLRRKGAIANDSARWTT